MATEKDNLPATVTETYLTPIDMDGVANVINSVDVFIKEIMVKGKDYGIIPGTRQKPTLLKAGAEKLSKAFSLAPGYLIKEQDVQPFLNWKSTKKWTDKKTGKTTVVDCDHKGYYRYVVECRLVHMKTNEFWASQMGSCDSLERGREDAPGNTILKMAQKRALCGAVLNATFSSDRFTVDVDSYSGDQAPKQSDSRAQQSNGQQDDEDYVMESKFGTMEKPGFCHKCEEKHIMVGDKIHKRNGKWVAVVCPSDGATDDNEPPADESQIGS